MSASGADSELELMPTPGCTGAGDTADARVFGAPLRLAPAGALGHLPVSLAYAGGPSGGA
jgi:hypothetical protein